MKYFMDTVETIEDGVGFPQFGALHLVWIAILAAVIIVNVLWYRRADDAGRSLWNKTVAILLILDELFKMVMLFIGGNYMPQYLPLHLCSVNIFLIAWHAWKPNEMLSNFLYTVCIPGAMAAILFPSWTDLPLLNFMHLHSFTVHILLVLYPLVLAVCGVLKPSVKGIPKCMLLLVALAVIALVANLIFDTNFMFLMEAEKGNPLTLFETWFGNHLIGFPILIAAVLAFMYVPMEIYRKHKRKMTV